MTYSFDPALSTDVDLVRFHIGDTDLEGGHFLENETIQYWVDNHSLEEAVLACIRYIITQLSRPNFSLDWLSVSNDQARAGYEKMLEDKAEEFGLNLSKLVASSSLALPYRADSYQEDAEYDGAP